MKTKLLLTVLIALCLSLCLIFASCGSSGTNESNGGNGGTTQSSETGNSSQTAGSDAINSGTTDSGKVSEGLEYTLSADEIYYTVTGIGECQDKDIYIQSTYNGLPVTSIGSYAFSGCTSLESVTIPESVTSIGTRAFKDCTGLTEINFNATEMVDLSGNNEVFYNAGTEGDGIRVTIGSNVTKIPSNLFYPEYHSSHEPKIASVVFEVNSVCASIGDYAFCNGKSLESITIPESVTSIGTRAFSNCGSLTEINFNATKMADLSENNYVFYNAGKNGNGITVNIGSNVTKIPSYLFYPSSSAPKITSVLFGENSECTSIGNSAFVGCKSLTSVTIPNSVTSIGSSAFRDCTSLTSITIPESVTSIGDYAFRNCKSLTSVTIGENVTSIGGGAFEDCKSLTSITIPNSVTSIGEYAFHECTSLTEIYFNATELADLSEYSYVFSNAGAEGDGITVNIGSNVTKIPAYLFCSRGHYLYSPKITSVVFNENSICTSIGESAFQYCSNLTSVTIGESVTSIGDDAFGNCTSLEYNEYDNGYYIGNEENPYLVLMDAKDTSITSCEINENTKVIYQSAFISCESLRNVIIPNSVKSIGSSAFENCERLTSITIPNSVISIGDRAFYDCHRLEYNEYDNGYYLGNKENPYVVLIKAKDTSITSCEINEHTKVIYQSAFSYCASLENVTIPNSVTSIGYGAFYGCRSLTSVTIPDGVTSIGEGAFGDCTSLTSITIPNSVTRIGSSAFESCRSLTSIIIPDGVTSIGDRVFSYCASLENVTIPNSVTSIGYWAFYGCRSLTSVTIPDGVTSVGQEAFRGCYMLVEIYNLSSLNITKGSSDYGYVGDYAINVYTVAEGEKKTFTTDVGFVFYDDGESRYLLGYIGNEAEITLPNSCNGYDYGIYKYAFYYRTSLTSITIPDSVTSIGESSFSNCTSLTSVTIPNSVASIGYRAFYDCRSLTIYCEATEQPDHWITLWNESRCPVVWGYKAEE